MGLIQTCWCMPSSRGHMQTCRQCQNPGTLRELIWLTWLVFRHGVQSPQYLRFLCSRTAEGPKMRRCGGHSCCRLSGWGLRRDERRTKLGNTWRLLAAWFWSFVFRTLHVRFHCFDPHRADFNNFPAQNTPCLVHVAWYCFRPWRKMLVGQPILIKFTLSHLDKG